MSTPSLLGHDGTKILKRAFVYLFLTGILVVVLLPFYWAVISSLKTAGGIFVYPPQWLPDTFAWSNYAKVLQAAPFDRYFVNTTFYAVSVMIGQLISCSLAGFAFARLRFPGRTQLFLLYLATMMIPNQVTLVPMYVLMRNYGWLDTWKVMIIPGLFGSPFGTFLMRQFMMTIPRDLDEAAVIDGASIFQIYSRVILPLTKPVLAVLGVFSIMAVWNDFMWPLIMLSSERNYTLTLGLFSFQGQYYTDWNVLMAAATLVMIPVIVAFFFAQRYIIEGITVTGMKG